MKTVTIKTYEFDELSDSAKEKARSWFREASCGYMDYSESTIDEAVEQAAHMGIEIKVNERSWTNKKTGKSGVTSEPCIYWSGFSSQGDGACFEGSWSAKDVDISKVADGWGEDPATTEIKRIAAEFDRIAKAYPESSFKVTHSGHYSHEFCTEFDFNFPDDNDGEDWPEDKRAEWDAECDALKKNARAFMKWIYRQLRKEYEYQQSDEAVDEDIKANDYAFTEEGSRRVVL